MQEDTIEPVSVAGGDTPPEEPREAEKQAGDAAVPEQQQDDTADDPAAEKRNKGGFQKRISELTRQREDERREKERLLALVEKLSTRELPQQQQPANNAPPKRDDFENYEDYLKADARYEARQEVLRAQEEIRRETQQQRRDSEQSRVAHEWASKLEGARGKYVDFDEVTASDAPVTPTMSSTIMESDFGPDIAYYLGKNPAEASRIAALSPSSQARELGRIEERLRLKPAKPSNAPEPIKPVGSRSSGGDPLSDKLPIDQWSKNFEKMFYKDRR